MSLENVSWEKCEWGKYLNILSYNYPNFCPNTIIFHNDKIIIIRFCFSIKNSQNINISIIQI